MGWIVVYRVWSSDGKRVVKVNRDTVRPSALFDDLVSSATLPTRADEGTADALSPTRSEAVPTTLKGVA